METKGGESKDNSGMKNLEKKIISLLLISLPSA
jgi:hypothetical protein